MRRGRTRRSRATTPARSAAWAGAGQAAGAGRPVGRGVSGPGDVPRRRSRAAAAWRRTRCRGGAVSSTSSRAGTHPSRSASHSAVRPDTRDAQEGGETVRWRLVGAAARHTGTLGSSAAPREVGRRRRCGRRGRTPPPRVGNRLRRGAGAARARMLGSCRATMSSATASPHSRPSSTGSGSGPNSRPQGQRPRRREGRPGDPAGPPQDQPEQHHQPHREKGEDGEDRPERGGDPLAAAAAQVRREDVPEDAGQPDRVGRRAGPATAGRRASAPAP